MRQESHPPHTLNLGFSLHLMGQTSVVTFPVVAGRVRIVNHSESISAPALCLLGRTLALLIWELVGELLAPSVCSTLQKL